MVTEITNVTDNIIIDCSSFTFIPYGSILPGFFESPNPVDNTPVWCKDWSAVSINLDGMAGKMIRLFFKTSDCTFRRHFGYAYIDVNSECSSEFNGAAYCPDDTAVTITAPYGYQSYTWYNSTFTQTLGNQQTLYFSPPPPRPTTPRRTRPGRSCSWGDSPTTRRTSPSGSTSRCTGRSRRRSSSRTGRRESPGDTDL